MRRRWRRGGRESGKGKGREGSRQTSDTWLTQMSELGRPGLSVMFCVREKAQFISNKAEKRDGPSFHSMSIFSLPFVRI